jgi:hypothetical protein
MVTTRGESRSIWAVRALTAVAFGLFPVLAAAQSSPATQSKDSLRIPALMISLGAGGARDMGDWSDGGPVQTASAQFLVGRHLAIEGEVTRWKTQMRDLRPIVGPDRPMRFEYVSNTDEGWSSGGNLLFRSEPRRVSGFVGGGAFVGQRRLDRRAGNALGGQALGGADVRVTGRLRAYADLRFTAMSGQVRLAGTGGVRLVAQTRRAITDARRRTSRMAQATVAPAEAAGKEVRVSLSNGARLKGVFVSLSAGELVLQELTISTRIGSRNTRYPLDQVLLIETVHHTARNGALIGCGAGLAVGEPVSAALDLGGGLGYAMTCGIGAGAGALIGAAIDAATANRHVVYSALSPSVRLAPIVAPRAAGAALTMRW